MSAGCQPGMPAPVSWRSVNRYRRDSRFRHRADGDLGDLGGAGQDKGTTYDRRYVLWLHQQLGPVCSPLLCGEGGLHRSGRPAQQHAEHPYAVGVDLRPQAVRHRPEPVLGGGILARSAPRAATS